MWILILILGIGSALFCTIHYLLIRDDYGHAGAYSKALSFNKTLDKKMQYYPDKHVTYLKLYMNIFLPVFTIWLAWQAVSNYKAVSESLGLPIFLYSLIIAATMLVNTIFFRFIDKLSFWMNIVALTLWILPQIAYSILAISLGLFLFMSVIPILWCIFFIANIVYFAKRKELFFCSAKRLKALYYEEET
nr:MAG TPA: hypothetical protein [Caudoviricetes sp.]